MYATPLGATIAPHFPHSLFSSSAIFFFPVKGISKNYRMLSKSPATSLTGPRKPLLVITIRNAQDQFNHHARAEEVDLRNRGEPGTVAEDFAALSLHSLSGAQPESKCCSDGGGACRDSDF